MAKGKAAHYFIYKIIILAVQAMNRQDTPRQI
jgi:hypothetical protein